MLLPFRLGNLGTASVLDSLWVFSSSGTTERKQAWFLLLDLLIAASCIGNDLVLLDMSFELAFVVLWTGWYSLFSKSSLSWQDKIK